VKVLDLAMSETRPVPNSASAPQSAPPGGFITTFAWSVLIALGVLVFLCDALPAIEARGIANVEIGSGPAASLYHFLFHFFWPGAILVHAGLATLWLACGTWRYSVRMLLVVLSMSARAGWIWLLYGVKEPHTNMYGEPFNVCGIPIFFAMLIWLTSLGFQWERFKGSNTLRREKLQVVDLLAWMTSISLLLAPAMTFFRALTPLVLADRAFYNTPLALAWAALAVFSAIAIREWLLTSDFGFRLPKIGASLLMFLLVCAFLIFAAHFHSRVWGAKEMAANILFHTVPSAFFWCMATGWALRELGVRLEKRPSPALSG
jgi:hypothetical protein